MSRVNPDERPPSNRLLAEGQQLAPVDSPLYNWSNPKRVGAGGWYTFLLSAYISDTQEKRAQTCALIRAFCDHFKCGDCSGHCKKYVEEHPPEMFVDSARKLFEWIITFMNAVNHRLAKPGYDVDLMWDLFDKKDFEFCNSNCDKKAAETRKIYRRNIPSRFASTIRTEQSRVINGRVPGRSLIQ